MSNITLTPSSPKVSLVSKSEDNITLQERAQNRINILERKRIALEQDIEIIKLVKNGCNLFWTIKEW